MDMMWYRRRGLMVTPHIDIVTGAIASFNSHYNKIRVKSLICDIEPIQEGEGDPSPDNVRPISGRTGLSVAMNGKNMLDTGDVLPKNLSVAAFASIPLDRKLYEYAINNPITVKIVGELGEAKTNFVLYLYDTINNQTVYIGGSSGFYPGINFTRSGLLTTSAPINPSTPLTLRIYAQPYTGSAISTITGIMITPGSTATDYEPYKGSTYSVNWETEAGTVYGGTMDVVSGKLTVGMMYKELQNIRQWRKSVSYPGGFYAPPEYFAEEGHEIKKVTPFICTHAKTARTLSEYVPGTCYMDGSVNIRIMSAETTIAQWGEYLDAQKTAGTPVSCCFYLVNPYIVQLTPQEVKTLLGVNNIWCDSGDVSVNYWKWGN